MVEIHGTPGVLRWAVCDATEESFQKAVAAFGYKTESNQTKTKWHSNAEWDHKHGFPNNVTTDTHQTKEQAEAVCRGLKLEGLGGERIHFPVRTWVSEVQE